MTENGIETTTPYDILDLDVREIRTADPAETSAMLSGLACNLSLWTCPPDHPGTH
ncbi:hypothetical protein [Streptomyces natalensis]|uniref:hypothetical protein n=1 Tax=Streptomyces natalensis TaxID=68242 RepID=UPI000A5D86B9|nr:hypothetical protein [Streptomyces natalensis]